MSLGFPHNFSVFLSYRYELWKRIHNLPYNLFSPCKVTKVYRKKIKHNTYCKLMEYKLYSEILTKNLLVHSKCFTLCSMICSISCVLSFSPYFKLLLLYKGKIKMEHMACNWGSKNQRGTYYFYLWNTLSA